MYSTLHHCACLWLDAKHKQDTMPSKHDDEMRPFNDPGEWTRSMQDISV